jgi:drug/metabolite transporter (DMT)-like permease
LETKNLEQTAFLSIGVRSMLISTLSFSMMNVFIKQLSHLPAMEVVFFRCLVSMTACLIGLRGTKTSLIGNNHLLLFLRGASGTIALFCLFVTLQNIPLATGVTLSYLSPIFTTIIAIFALNEKIRKTQWLFYLISFAGVLVIKGFDVNFPTIYLVTGISAALFSGIAYNLVRTMKEREHPLVIVLHFQLVGVVAGFLISLFYWKMPLGWDWIYLLATGVLTQMGQVYLTHALQAERVASVSIINYTGIIYALIFGSLVFGETYAKSTILGILLVVIGVALSILFGKRRIDVIENTVA